MTAPHKEILKACNDLGQLYQLEFTAPTQLGETKEEIVEQISSHSHIPMEKVVLKNGWWKQGSIPLLAFEENTDKPVILIPTFSGRYRIFNSKKNRSTRVSKDEATQLQNRAFCFYPPLPPKVKGLKELAFSVTKERKKEIGMIAFLTLCGTLLTLLPLLAMQWVLNDVYDKGTPDLGWSLAIGLGIAAIGWAILIYIRNRRLLRLDGFFAHRVQPMLWKKIFEFPAFFFKRETKLSIFQKIMGLETIRQGVGHLTPQILFSSCFSLLYLFAMAYFSYSLTLVSLPFLGVAFWNVYHLIHTNNRIKETIQKKEEEASSFLSESLSRMTSVRSWGQEKIIYKRLKMHLNQNLKRKRIIGSTQISLTLIYLSLPPLLLSLNILGIAVGWLAPRIGDFFAFYLALIVICVTLDTLTRTLLEITNSMRLLKQSEKIFHENHSPSRQSLHLASPKGEIRFDKVTFHYQESPSSLFKNLSLSIAPREKVAIVGAPGSGKTTLIRLLLGLERPHSGTIFFDGHSLENQNLQKVRQNIGTIFDTEGIFAGTIYDNIRVGRTLTMEQIERAIELADFQKDLETYPMGISTLLPERGISISSGERQRLLLVRGLASTPSILLLDQVLCELDPESRKRIFDNLQKLPITQIFTTHDPEPFKNIVDRIIYLG